MENVKKYIQENKKDFFIKGNVSEEEVEKAEERLSFAFDKHFRTYLKEYGIISYESMETAGLGVSEGSYLNTVTLTLEIKGKYTSFPSNSVILENIGEDNYVIYTMLKGVFQWSPNRNTKIDDTLEGFLLKRFKEVIK
ncbi:MAG: SMI1/KNR4 family protein [Deltaproteobacteria bacterium]|nr:SMI1/KNR4 family protein [Deltaproteobacteria bacterium]